MVTSIVDFSLSHRGGLLSFSPADVPSLIITSVNQTNVLTSNASTLLLSLAASLTKIYTNNSRPDISQQIALLMAHFCNALFPSINFPEMQHFTPEMLQQTVRQPFQILIISNPEVFSQFFRFISQTISRYSMTWSQHTVQRWMSCILVALGYPESVLAFQGATDFLVHPFIQ